MNENSRLGEIVEAVKQLEQAFIEDTGIPSKKPATMLLLTLLTILNYRDSPTPAPTTEPRGHRFTGDFSPFQTPPITQKKATPTIKTNQGQHLTLK